MSRTPDFIRRALRGAALAGSLLLGGCASVYLVDNQVQSYARWSEAAAPAAVPTGPQVYRFERLPSQGEGSAAASQDELEALARAALAPLGWTLAEPGASAPWTVQVAGGTIKLPRAPWEDPWDGFWPGFGLAGRDYVVTGSGQVIWMPVFPRMETPYYQRKVSLLIRQAGTGRVVYETHAAHDGRWGSMPGLWRAMLDAALRDFPQPPGGARQVNIEVPR
jgi:hypothetical protein